MRSVDGEAVARTEKLAHRSHLIFGDLLDGAAAAAVEVTVLDCRQDVVFLSAVRSVAMPDQADLLENVEGAIDRRRYRLRVELAAALDQVGSGDVAVDAGKDLDQQAPLRSPAKTARPKPLRDSRPWVGGLTGGGTPEGGHPCLLTRRNAGCNMWQILTDAV
jgi:hypothetical protein